MKIGKVTWKLDPLIKSVDSDPCVILTAMLPMFLKILHFSTECDQICMYFLYSARHGRGEYSYTINRHGSIIPEEMLCKHVGTLYPPLHEPDGGYSDGHDRWTTPFFVFTWDISPPPNAVKAYKVWADPPRATEDSEE